MMFRKSRDLFLTSAFGTSYSNSFPYKIPLLILLTFFLGLTLKSNKALSADSIKLQRKHYFSLPAKNEVPEAESSKYKAAIVRGPVTVHLPKQYKKSEDSENFPLLLSLHGFGSFPLFHEGFFKLRKIVNSKKFILATLPGSFNKTGQRFWNAGDWCCDFYKSGRNDIRYILHVLKRLKKLYKVNPKKVALLGHSNGAFMSYKLLCKHPELFSGVISISGAVPKGIGSCKSPGSASIIHIHGKKDVVIKYNGSPFHISADETVSYWLKHQKCSVDRYKKNQNIILKWGSWPKIKKSKTWSHCQKKSKISFWSISREGHFTDLTRKMKTKMIDFVFKN